MERAPLRDKTFGKLTWDDTLDYWNGHADIPGVGPVRISVDSEDDPDISPETAFDNARRAYRTLRDKEPAARDFAAEALLDTHNQAWNEGAPIDEAAFADKLTLEDISFHPDGSAELFYNAADLFGGHTLIVTIDEDGTFDDAEIAG
ncbi:MAG: DUF2262 domain-containing protein [Armatimonadetes bacterium]|nr:DUF2262 domain-containing protein [Armatimonadota bacterium]